MQSPMGPSLLRACAALLVIKIALVVGLTAAPIVGSDAETPAPQPRLPVAADRPLTDRERVAVKIRRSALLYGVDPATAHRIAMCESGLNPLAKNAHSTASGVYQFIAGTWAAIGAQGSPFDEDENIRQFMLHYPDHPEWWVCK